MIWQKKICWIVATFLLEKLAQPLSIFFHTETKRFLWAKSGNLASCNSSKICFAFPCPIRWFQTVFEFFIKISGFMSHDKIWPCKSQKFTFKIIIVIKFGMGFFRSQYLKASNFKKPVVISINSRQFIKCGVFKLRCFYFIVFIQI